MSALVYNGFSSSIDAMRGKHDTVGSMVAGGLTGGLYKSTGKRRLHAAVGFPNLIHSVSQLAGLKPALAAAAVISSLAGVWSYVKRSV